LLTIFFSILFANFLPFVKLVQLLQIFLLFDCHYNVFSFLLKNLNLIDFLLLLNVVFYLVLINNNLVNLPLTRNLVFHLLLGLQFRWITFSTDSLDRLLLNCFEFRLYFFAHFNEVKSIRLSVVTLSVVKSASPVNPLTLQFVVSSQSFNFLCYVLVILSIGKKPHLVISRSCHRSEATWRRHRITYVHYVFAVSWIHSLTAILWSKIHGLVCHIFLPVSLGLIELSYMLVGLFNSLFLFIDLLFLFSLFFDLFISFHLHLFQIHFDQFIDISLPIITPFSLSILLLNAL